MDAVIMAFPLTTIHGRVAPGTDPNNPSGAYEAVHKQTPFKILKELKRAVQNYRVNSPFTLGIVQGLAEGSCLITVAHDQARKSPISLDQLIGSGNWGRTQEQVLMEDQAIEQVRRYYIRAWEKIEVKGQVSFTLREDLTSPERQSLTGQHLISQATPVIRAKLSITWFNI